MRADEAAVGLASSSYGDVDSTVFPAPSDAVATCPRCASPAAWSAARSAALEDESSFC